jgi:hypothetical protein
MVIPFVLGTLAGIGGTAVYHEVTEVEPVPQPPTAGVVAKATPKSERPEPVVLPETASLPGPAVSQPAESGANHGERKATAAKVPKASGGQKTRQRSLASERTLIEMARNALARGNGEDALNALRQHKKAYPKGKFTEEREALTVLSLINLKRVDQARKKAALFKKRFPNSMFGKTIDGALKRTSP